MSPVGTILVEVHRPLLGIDDNGNLVLNTDGNMNVANANPGLVGKGIGNAVTITNGVGASANICNVTFQATDSLGNPLSKVASMEVLLSDAATGAGLTATTASGGIAAAAGGGVVLGVLTAAKALLVQTNASGQFILAITDTAKTLFYPVAQYAGATVVGAQLTAASYHA